MTFQNKMEFNIYIILVTHITKHLTYYVIVPDLFNVQRVRNKEMFCHYNNRYD